MPIEMVTLPDADILRETFSYNQRTGLLVWRARPPITKQNKRFNSLFAGKVAGTLESWGYVQIRLFGRLQMAHRIIWKMMTGKDPVEQIDHKDGNCANNRWRNLREANQPQNQWNCSMRSTNTSGTTNIFRLETKRDSSKKWRVKFSHNGSHEFVGDYHTKEEAISARNDAYSRCRSADFNRT